MSRTEGLYFSTEEARERARAVALRGDHVAAAREYQRVFDVNPDDLEVAMRLAYHYVQACDGRKAGPVYIRAAAVYAGLGKKQRSLLLARRAYEIDPDGTTVARLSAWARLAGPMSTTLLCEAADHHAAKGNEGTARGLLRLAADLDPTRVAVCERLIGMELTLGSRDEACDRLDSVGRMLLSQGRMTEFVPVAERLLSLNPDNAFFLRALIEAYLRTGRAKEAVPLLHALVRADPSDPKALVTLAEVHAGLRQRKAALAALARFIWVRYREGGESARRDIDVVLDQAHRWWPGDARWVQGIIDLGLFGPEPETSPGPGDLELVFVRIEPPPPPPIQAWVA